MSRVKQAVLPKLVKPKDVDVSCRFVGSNWCKSETETVARNIVILLQGRNHEEGVPFTVAEYTKFCNANRADNNGEPIGGYVGHAELSIIKGLADDGYLVRDGESYRVSLGFVAMLSPWVK